MERCWRSTVGSRKAVLMIDFLLRDRLTVAVMLCSRMVSVNFRSMSVTEEGIGIYHRVWIDRSDRSERSERSCLLTGIAVRIRQILCRQSRRRPLLSWVRVLQAGRVATLSRWSATVRHELFANNWTRLTPVLMVLQVFMSHSSFFRCQPLCVLLGITILFLNSDEIKDGLDFVEHQGLVLWFDAREASGADRSLRPIL